MTTRMLLLLALHKCALILFIKETICFPLLKDRNGAIGELGIFKRHESAITRIQFNTANDIIDISLNRCRSGIIFFPSTFCRNMTRAAISGDHILHIAFIRDPGRRCGRCFFPGIAIGKNDNDSNHSGNSEKLLFHVDNKLCGELVRTGNNIRQKWKFQWPLT